MDNTAFFKFTYGLFLVGVEQEGNYNGCIINTAAQATSEPPRILMTMQKQNYTTELLMQKRSASLTLLSRQFPLDQILHFGMQSGRDMNKFTMPYETDHNGNPFLTDGMNARFALEVSEAIDLGTHQLFLCDVRDALTLSDGISMSYGDYRTLKSGGTLDGGAAASQKKWVCSVCHYEYDGDVPFESLPDDYRCPICGAGKEHFSLV
ncbi:MAG: flavin reductase [Oscillospiraceae bacterium]|nr:flavin reductase [Oscillospiraceae bacterium]